jgi:hypothetical protein
MTDEDFDELKSHQYCDNEGCSHYEVVGGGNLRIKTRKNRQIYCNSCKSAPFSVRRGTMLYGLRTDIRVVIDCLLRLSGGTGSNELSRQTGITTDSLRKWTVLASIQMEQFSAYMQSNMHLEQVQIDEFWSYVKKKRELE